MEIPASAGDGASVRRARVPKSFAKEKERQGEVDQSDLYACLDSQGDLITIEPT